MLPCGHAEQCIPKLGAGDRQKQCEQPTNCERDPKQIVSGWCGSYAPGAQPLPEPPQHTALATMGCNAAGDSRFGSRDLHMAAAAITRKARKLLAAPFAGTWAAKGLALGLLSQHPSHIRTVFEFTSHVGIHSVLVVLSCRVLRSLLAHASSTLAFCVFGTLANLSMSVCGTHAAAATA